MKNSCNTVWIFFPDTETRFKLLQWEIELIWCGHRHSLKLCNNFLARGHYVRFCKNGAIIGESVHYFNMRTQMTDEEDSLSHTLVDQPQTFEDFLALLTIGELCRE